MHVALKPFLADGVFGDVRVGMHRTEVLAVAGEPSEFHRGSSPDEAELWINGRTTFWFSGPILKRVGVYYTLEYSTNDLIQYGPEFPDRGAHVDPLLEFMQRENISYAASHDSRGLVTSANVEIVTGHQGLLNSIICPALEIPPYQRRRPLSN